MPVTPWSVSTSTSPPWRRKAAAARHAVGFFRREGIFESDERKTPDRRHGSSCKSRAMVGSKANRRQPLMTSIPKTHRRVVLVRRPPGEPAESDFRVEEAPVPEPRHGEVLVKVHYLSLDPYQRGRMRDAASYASPVGLNEVMTGGTVGEVVASQHPGFKVGDIVEDRLGWQEYAIGGGPAAAQGRSLAGADLDRQRRLRHAGHDRLFRPPPCRPAQARRDRSSCPRRPARWARWWARSRRSWAAAPSASPAAPRSAPS